MIKQTVSFAEGQRVEDRCDEALGNIEGRVTVVAGAAAGILGDEIVARTADRAAVVQRLGPGVAEQSGQIGAEPLAQFGAEAVVVADAIVLKELDAGGAEFGIRRRVTTAWCPAEVARRSFIMGVPWE